MATVKGGDKKQGGTKQQPKESFTRKSDDKTSSVRTGDKVKGNIETTSTGPRNPIKDKKS